MKDRKYVHLKSFYIQDKIVSYTTPIELRRKG